MTELKIGLNLWPIRELTPHRIERDFTTGVDYGLEGTLLLDTSPSEKPMLVTEVRDHAGVIEKTVETDEDIEILEAKITDNNLAAGAIRSVLAPILEARRSQP